MDRFSPEASCTTQAIPASHSFSHLRPPSDGSLCQMAQAPATAVGGKVLQGQREGASRASRAQKAPSGAEST